MKFRKPTKGEVGVKITRSYEQGCEFIPFVKGHAVAQILDDSVGPDRWQKRTEAVPRAGENAFVKTTISVYDAKLKEWISKDGVGESGGVFYADKSQETDSLKRAALSWGIGRELRVLADGARLFIDASMLDIDRLEGLDGQPQYVVRTRLSVADLEYGDDGSVLRIAIKDDKGKILYSRGPEPDNGPSNAAKDAGPAKKPADKAAKPVLRKPKDPSDLAEAKKTPIDVGGASLAGKPLSDATPPQALWVFRHTRKQAVKNALLVIAKADMEYGDAFRADGINI